MSMRVLKPGLLTTVQDAGRVGFQKYGVIVSGAMDAFAYRAANVLVGNDEGEAALEITFMGPGLLFESSAVIAICGADMAPTVDGHPVPLWRPVFVRQGSRLQFGGAKRGVRSYLAVAGGFDLPKQMNSYSTYLRAGIGGYQGRPLREGDLLPFKPPSALGRKMMEQLSDAAGDKPFGSVRWRVWEGMIPDYRPNPTVRVIEGPQFQWFTPESVEQFFSGEFTVLSQSDRMGYRLQGPKIRLSQPRELLSEAVTFGTVQIPPDGNPIVLMADRQTTGGYPKIAQVISADLPLLAQVQPGSAVRFQRVSLEEAQELFLFSHMDFDMLKKSILMKF